MDVNRHRIHFIDGVFIVSNCSLIHGGHPRDRVLEFVKVLSVYDIDRQLAGKTNPGNPVTPVTPHIH